MAGKIKKLLENELVGGTQTTDVYPVTSTKAVYDENNERLDNIINKIEPGIIYDVSANNDGAVFESLQALLSSPSLNTLIPTSVRCGGMSIRFIQSSVPNSDNKYVQYRLMSDTFNTTKANWQGVDDKPTGNSENLITSRSIFNSYQIIRVNSSTVNSQWTIFYYNLPAGTVVYYRIHSLLSNSIPTAFSRGGSWNSNNLIMGIDGQTEKYGQITLDRVSNFGLLLYSEPLSYDSLNIEISLNPMYDSLYKEIEDVNKKTYFTFNGDNVTNYFTPIFRGLKAGTKIYTRLNALPTGVTSDYVALVKHNSWSSDTILPNAIILGQTVEYTLPSDCDVNLRFYNSALTSFVGLDLEISLVPIYNQVKEIEQKVEQIVDYIDFPDYQIIEVVVDINGTGTFTSIRDAVMSITDATSDKRYRVFVKNGTYQELDIITKSYVDIVGESKDGVIIIGNGKRTDTSPADYHFEDYANTPYNLIPVIYKHLLWHCSNSSVSNVTMIINDCKYVVHQDEATGAYVATVKNCVIMRTEQSSSGSGNLVGAGLRHTEYIEYIGCDFITKVPGMDFRAFSTAVYVHNMANDDGECGVTIKDCNIYNCHILTFASLGAPNQHSFALIDNVHVDSKFYGISLLNASNDSYTTKVIIKNCNPNFILFDENTISYFKNALNPYTMSICQVSENILLGQPLGIVEYGSIQPIGLANSGDNFVLALEDIDSGSIGYCDTGVAGVALAVAGTYSWGDDLYIYNGKFTKDIHGQKVACAMTNKVLDTDGLIEIRKLLL